MAQANLSAKIIWWLHESQGILEHLPSTIDIPLLQSKVHILTVSRYAQSFLPQGLQSTILKNGIPDTSQLFRQPENPSAAFKFAWIGTLAPYKGTDIFCNAIALLPENMREQCQFFIAGEPMLFLPDYFERIIQTAQTYPQLQYLGHLTHEAALNLMTQSDIIVSSSRDESFSLVCTEAAMLSKPIILNQNVGIADMFTHGESCLLHETENAQSLATQMLWAYENRETAAKIGRNARKIFEQELTIEQFSQNFMQILQNEITA
ncbi:glycosyltransferase family 4 protein [Kingella negevensis]|uniref:glycosyltransferase family 4 protein n=1 Tax=Kingella negevensis TaxID=1522312 RepID=UPI00050A1CC2|nr:glycosyltransferase family 4 protein [Kingella negevensis]MDK4689422.1 glycosyltransferase family 4 protein [Kingella negevensis]WII90150.1 glycosyltransferase family 4 protein [Kingella negevensis]WII94136.1 glycosyltransferase family 4 protein [Kingella negevensis]